MCSPEPTERYLQSVLEIAEEGGSLTRSAIARRLRGTVDSTCASTTRLEQAGLITERPNRVVDLTESGAGLAVAIARGSIA